MTNNPTDDERPEVVERLDLDLDLPPLPRTVSEISRLSSKDRETYRVRRLKEIISSDPGLSAMVLRRVNSAYYGLRRRVGNIDQAIVLLGFEEVQRLVLTSELVKLRQLFSSNKRREIFRAIVQDSIGHAWFTHLISNHIYLASTHLAYSTGLFHSVGRLILLYNFPDTYEEMWTDHNVPRPPSPRTERESWDTDFVELGATATEYWSFPDALVLGVSHCQNPRALKDDRVLYELALAVQAAEKVNRRLIRELPSQGPTNGHQSTPGPLKELVRLSQTDLDDLTAHLREKKNDVTKYIEMALEAT